jgi:hypothetical protein
LDFGSARLSWRRGKTRRAHNRGSLALRKNSLTRHLPADELHQEDRPKAGTRVFRRHHEWPRRRRVLIGLCHDPCPTLRSADMARVRIARADREGSPPSPARLRCLENHSSGSPRSSLNKARRAIWFEWHRYPHPLAFGGGERLTSTLTQRGVSRPTRRRFTSRSTT